MKTPLVTTVRSRAGIVTDRSLITLDQYRDMYNQHIRDGWTIGYIQRNELLCMISDASTIIVSLLPEKPLYLIQFGNGKYWSRGGGEDSKLQAIRFSNPDEAREVIRISADMFKHDEKYTKATLEEVPF